MKVPNNIVDHSSSDIEDIYKPDRVINMLAELISEVNVKLDYCLDSMGISYCMDCEPIWNATNYILDVGHSINKSQRDKNIKEQKSVLPLL